MLFVSNLAPNVTSKDLYAHFHEAGVVFDALVPQDKQSGGSRGFGFVCFKTEWDARKAISSLHGRLIGGCKISVQMAGYARLHKKVDHRQGALPVFQAGGRASAAVG